MPLDPTQELPPPRLRPGARLGAVVSTYHREVTGAMLASAEETLRAAGLEEGALLVVEAPGSFELPLLASRLAARPDVDAVLCFGLVLRGETDHDRHIASAVAQGLTRVALESGKPVLFGVLTCASEEQARRRAARRAEGGLDKGREVALAAARSLAALGTLERAQPRTERAR